MNTVGRWLALCLIACGVSGVSGVSYAQMAVFDASSYGQQVQQVAAWSQQLRAMTDQYQKMQQQYGALTGNRGFGNLFNDPSLRQMLPANAQAIYDRIRTNGLSGMTPGAQAVRQQYGLTYNCADKLDVFERNSCEQQQAKPAQDYDVFQTSLAAANQRSTQIQNLVNQINQTQDPKDVAELQARIQAEQASLQNETIRMQLMLQLADAQNRLATQARMQREQQVREQSMQMPVSSSLSGQ